MNCRNSRQVLDCGDGVGEVTALAVAALKHPMLAADRATPSQSGDSEDSVAAVQDASRADLLRTRFIVLMRGKKPSWLPMNRVVALRSWSSSFSLFGLRDRRNKLKLELQPVTRFAGAMP